jgi:ATP-binding cassette subfamily C (CFTR/MRP) protein 1
VAVERLAKFASLPPESELVLPKDPDTREWPSAGHIVFDNASMKYRENLDPVLRDLSFEVRPGERVGVCGRTGAGKSSILVALFRIAPLYQGRILIDNVDISKIGVHTLRQQLSIIPQDPVLFQGTLRWNLDPLKRATDQQLWDVLAESNLKEFVEQRDGQLEMSLDINGENLSVGQRQLVCLARAILRNAKVMVLDEATASVDRNTDALVQTALRKLQGVTTFTIAHRIDTIIDSDKILVLGKGKVLEYDSPGELQKDPSSEFSQIVKEYHAKADEESG